MVTPDKASPGYIETYGPDRLASAQPTLMTSAQPSVRTGGLGSEDQTIAISFNEDSKKNSFLKQPENSPHVKQFKLPDEKTELINTWNEQTTLQPVKESEMRFETVPEENDTLKMSFIDMMQIYQKSYDVLNWVFMTQFKKTKEYQDLVIQLNDNMIEYRFYQHAGFQVQNRAV